MRAIGAIARAARTLLACLCIASSARASDAGASVRVDVAAEVLVGDVRRIGVNLGTWHAWGAEQLGQNVLQNPGFEGLIDRAIVIVRTASATGFTDDTPGLGRPDGFWRGARFDVRAGSSAGQQGAIADSVRAGPDGYPHFRTAEPAPPLAAGDVLALTRIDDSQPPARWHGGAGVEPVRSDVPPGSPGVRAVALAATAGSGTELVHYVDAIGQRAGKLLPIDGAWRLAFWTRADGAGSALQVRLLRSGTTPFVDRHVTPLPTWQRVVIDFIGRDDGPATPLELRFTAAGAGRVLLDDAQLSPRDGTAGEFRRPVLDALRALRPGFLRDWQGTQGSTLENRLAADVARRVTRSSAQPDATVFEYSLPAFLDLCRDVGASPWIAVPTTFSDAEWRELGRTLAARAAADGFGDVVLEFGNENWNPLSRAAGIPDPVRHGAAAARAFGLLRETAPSLPLRTAVNGQFANPTRALQFLASVPQADLLAVAPYFLYALPAGLRAEQRLAALAADDGERFRVLTDGTRGGAALAVAEVNLHTTGGNAGPEDRDPTVAGAAAGTALARRLLHAQAAGARHMAAYTLAGYDAWTDDHTQFVKLWGLTRDLAGRPRLRPTGLAVALLNRAIAGDRHRVRVESAATDLTVAAYRATDGWSAALVSTRDTPMRVEITFPDGGATAAPVHALTLAAPGPWATNETQGDVRIAPAAVAHDGRRVSAVLPAWGMVVLLPQERDA